MARNTFIIRDGTLQFLNMNHNLTQSNQPQTLRLQTMVPHSTNVGTTIRAPQMTAIPNSSVITSRSGQVQLSQPLTIQTTPANAQAASSQPSQMSPNTAKIKCKNFLSTLIRLASDQPEQTANNVKNLIQSLIVSWLYGKQKYGPTEFHLFYLINVTNYICVNIVLIH